MNIYRMSLDELESSWILCVASAAGDNRMADEESAIKRRPAIIGDWLQSVAKRTRVRSYPWYTTHIQYH